MANTQTPAPSKALVAALLLIGVTSLLSPAIAADDDEPEIMAVAMQVRPPLSALLSWVIQGMWGIAIHSHLPAPPCLLNPRRPHQH